MDRMASMDNNQLRLMGKKGKAMDVKVSDHSKSN